jgi:hypothetical protein
MMENAPATNTVIKPIANVPEAVAYTDIISPILESKCYGCHNANKQKGGLRMDEINLLMKGGKNGKIIEPGNADASEMIKRLLLPTDDDHHMPPKEKPQPTESQIALLHWWITNNADTKKKVKELVQTEKIKPILMALQTPVVEQKPRTDIPAVEIEKADDKIIEQLKARNIMVLPVAQNTHYLMANFVTDSVVDKTDLQLLVQLKPQLIWLKINNTNIADDALASIAQLTSLTKLDLSNTFISDKGLALLNANIHLQTLNLVGTKVTQAGIAALKGLTQLQSLYLYRTGFDSKYLAALKVIFPKTTIDTGGYLVPLIEQDTMLVKAAQY